MNLNYDYIYSVEATAYRTSTLLKAIEVAKKKAIEKKLPVKIYLNGNPYALVDKKGILVAA